VAEDAKPVVISVVVPCFRSEESLEPLVTRLVAALEPMGEPYEIVLVNDASPDDTWRVIRELAARFERLRGFDLLFNTGQYRATLCGLQHARGSYMVTMDDDLQHRPEEVPALVQALLGRPDCDCVMAAFRSRRHGVVRNLGAAVMGLVFEAFYGKPRGIQATSFRAMRRQLVEAICAHGTASPNVNALVFQTTRRIVNLEVPHHPRVTGRSGYKLPRLARIMTDNVLSVSTLPLKCVSMLGTASAAGSLLLGAYYLIRYVTVGFRVPGFATLVLLIIFFGGISLFSIGLLGEYVIRIMDEVRGRPRHIVRERVGAADTPEARGPGRGERGDSG
jgi:dolichol-phosphate mannosyltransferase/undecaprenyl-phosphate 4-deoxy-4-formamido-L-arabinose transferase